MNTPDEPNTPNIFKTPTANLADQEFSGPLSASRGARLGGAIIDSIVLIGVIFPFVYLFDGFDYIGENQEPPMLYTLSIAAVSLIIFAAVNGALLVKHGQTVGKKIVGTQIVDLNGHLPSVNALIKRYAVFFIPGYIPVIGQFLSIINSLFIFGAQKRCLHDWVAKTKVIYVVPKT